MSLAEWLALAALTVAIVGPFLGAFFGAQRGLALLEQKYEQVAQTLKEIHDRLEIVSRRTHRLTNVATRHGYRLQSVEGRLKIPFHEDEDADLMDDSK